MSKKVDMKREYRNSIRTKKLIRAAFAELIGEKKRISNISVSELAERADIAKSTFYNHYDDVYAIADEMMREITDGLNLIIDAMDILYSKNIDGFCIVSSDSDFTRLIMRIREDGKVVYGMGEKKSPKALINACDKFIYLDVNEKKEPKGNKKTALYWY